MTNQIYLSPNKLSLHRESTQTHPEANLIQILQKSLNVWYNILKRLDDIKIIKCVFWAIHSN